MLDEMVNDLMGLSWLDMLTIIGCCYLLTWCVKRWLRHLANVERIANTIAPRPIPKPRPKRGPGEHQSFRLTPYRRKEKP